MTAPGGPPPQVVVPGAGWVDVASRAIVQVGFPVVVAGVLLWFLLTRFQDNMNAITTRMSDNTAVVTTLIEQQREELVEVQRQTGEMAQQTQVLRGIEADGAKLVDLHAAELEALKRLEAHKP